MTPPITLFRYEEKEHSYVRGIYKVTIIRSLIHKDYTRQSFGYIINSKTGIEKREVGFLKIQDAINQANRFTDNYLF